MKKMLFVFNPHSGKGQISSCLLEICDIFTKGGYEVTVHPTQAKNDGCNYVTERWEDFDVIVCSGGDGTLNETIKSMMTTGCKKPLGYIPAGTMNDFARFWDFRDTELEDNIERLVRHRVRRVDIGCIRYTNQQGERCRRYFLNCICIGLVASVMNLRRRAHGLLGALSFIPSSLLMIFQRLEYKMRLRIESDVIDRKVMTVCIGNARGYGFTPNAVPYNGLLDVSVVYHPQVTQLMEGFYLLYSGKILNHGSVHPYRTKEVTVEKAERALIGIDGRLMNAPVGTFKVQVEQEVLNFLI